ncbi:alpha/beta hydrolase [Mariniphaga anaerophila]|uniref:alpha/beta hydrolase n=1 Tax=Mariniphaga anaerophila TaxID=1484053 RepID=UPI001C31929E|nr:alpha/beta hydrolase [Mariniphaga anaerophila]
MPSGVVVEKDINYVSYNNRQLFLDIYRPSNVGNEKLPVLIVVRGGGWARGDKEGFGHMAAALAQRGFASICIEYRTSTEALFPAALMDLKSAVQWIESNSDKYGFDPYSIGAVGGSAGAHLAALLGVTSKINSLNPSARDEGFAIQAVVGLAPLMDFTKLSDNKGIVKWLGKPLVVDYELWKSASPISYVDKDTPPMLLIHSSSDPVVHYEQSILAIDKLAKMDIYTELVLIPNAPHAFWNYEEWFEYTMDKTASFFRAKLIE